MVLIQVFFYVKYIIMYHFFSLLFPIILILDSIDRLLISSQNV